jgi:hypothetical protein
MMTLGNLFRKRAERTDAEAQAIARIKAQVLAILDLPDHAVVGINEIICTDPACPGTETVILVMMPGQKTRAFKSALAITDMTEEAVREALKPA